MGAGDLLDLVRLKLEELVWKTRQGHAAFIAQKRTKAYALFGLAGTGVIVLVVVVTIIALNLNADGAKPPEDSVLFPAGNISDEEFFVPGEPDFLPPVILYREPRKQWTNEDAAPFWTDPATLDDNWSNNVEKYVDKLLESVP
ncbi:MAG: hypothetical protein LBG27_03630 [Spirochaetaceae bacterium]|jgi:hypothetical protein|nr:hypothetical protein [Spirochaetaceae bacterium]